MCQTGWKQIYIIIQRRHPHINEVGLGTRSSRFTQGLDVSFQQLRPKTEIYFLALGRKEEKWGVSGVKSSSIQMRSLDKATMARHFTEPRGKPGVSTNTILKG